MRSGSGFRRVLVIGGGSLLAAGLIAPGLVRSPLDARAISATHVLSWQTVQNVPGATLVGTVPATMPLTLDVAIGTNLAAKQAAVEALYSPSSPTYHQFYTPATWAAQFSVDQATYDSVVQPLSTLGMTVLYSSPARDLVELSSTAAQAEAAFQIPATAFQEFSLSNGHVFYANSVAPTVASAVDAVQGLTNIGLAGMSNPLNNDPYPQQAACQLDPSGGQQCLGSMEYTALDGVYDVGTTYTGAGQKLAVIGDGDTQGPTADLHKFETDHGLPTVTTHYVPTDSPSFCVGSGIQGATCDTAGEGEWALDGDSSTAMAPGVTDLYYYFPNALGNASGFSAWASDPNGPLQANASWGECELFGTTNTTLIPVADGTMITYTNSFVQLAGEGRTQFVSTGDQGGGCVLTGLNGITNGGVPQVQWPASSEWVVSVGGTVLYSDGNGHRANLGGTCTPQTTPSNCDEITWTHTGGGTSIVRPQPAWQTQDVGNPPITGQCTIDQNLNPVAPPIPCRGTPDVAALSGDITVAVADSTGGGVPGNGFNDVEGGTPQTATGGPTAGSETADGGTSLSDPLWEGMWARIQQAAPTSKGWGFAAPLLYNIAKNPAQDVCAFYDVAIGSNGQQVTMPRSAADPTGWDYTSGLGTPDVSCIISSLAANQASTPEVPSVPLLLALPGLLGIGALARRRRRT